MRDPLCRPPKAVLRLGMEEGVERSEFLRRLTKTERKMHLPGGISINQECKGVFRAPQVPSLP